jgi:beta-phosphoglucomutase-like phosphatase (HAD superfamily)
MKLRIPEGDFHFHLFDGHGTIADSMPLHYIVWKQALAEWSCDFRGKALLRMGGWPVVKIISNLNQARGLTIPAKTVARRKEGLYFELLPQLKTVPKVLEHIEARHGQIPFAVVSGSAPDSVTASLRTLRLLDFHAVGCADDYKKSKPDPECLPPRRV